MTTPPPRPGDRLVLLALLAFTADVLIYYFTVGPLQDWAERRSGERWWGMLAHYGLRAASAALFAAIMVNLRTVSRLDLGLALRPIREDLAWTARFAGLLAAASILYIVLSLVFCRLFDIDLRAWGFFETDREGWVAYLVCSVIAAPLVEETVYRGLLTPALRSGYGDRGAIIAGAALFYVLHLVYGQPFWMVHYLIAGAILTWAFVKRGKLWICVVLHAGGNLMVVLDDALRDFAPEVFRALVGQ